MDRHIHNRGFCLNGVAENTPFFTNIGPEHFKAWTSHRFFPRNTGYTFRGRVKRGYLPVQVHGKDPIGDTVQYDLIVLI